LIIIDNIIVSDEFINAHFSCNLSSCKGACCVAGDAGAPLEDEEIGMIEDNIDGIKPFMEEKGIAVVEKDGVFDYDETSNLVTPLVNDAECAFVVFRGKIAYCAIEQAFYAGKSDFIKPISCHLYPIRLSEKNGFTYIQYHQWSVCVPAVKKGKKEGIPLYKMLKEALIRRFGNEWYNKFIEALKRR
jgi:hypothetical protein